MEQYLYAEEFIPPKNPMPKEFAQAEVFVPSKTPMPKEFAQTEVFVPSKPPMPKEFAQAEVFVPSKTPIPKEFAQAEVFVPSKTLIPKEFAQAEVFVPSKTPIPKEFAQAEEFIPEMPPPDLKRGSSIDPKINIDFLNNVFLAIVEKTKAEVSMKQFWRNNGKPGSFSQWRKANIERYNNITKLTQINVNIPRIGVLGNDQTLIFKFIDDNDLTLENTMRLTIHIIKIKNKINNRFHIKIPQNESDDIEIPIVVIYNELYTINDDKETFYTHPFFLQIMAPLMDGTNYSRLSDEDKKIVNYMIEEVNEYLFNETNEYITNQEGPPESYLAAAGPHVDQKMYSRKYLKYKIKYLELKKLEKKLSMNNKKSGGGSFDTFIKRMKESSELKNLKKKTIKEIFDDHTCIKVKNPLHHRSYEDFMRINSINDLSELKKQIKIYNNEKNNIIKNMYELRKKNSQNIAMTNERMK